MSHAASNSRPSPRRAPAGRLLAAGTLLALAACTAGVQSTSTDANTFFARHDQSGLSGTYDPAGFTTSEVQKLLDEVCTIRGSLVDYAEQPTNGGVAFTSRCRGASDIRFGTVRYNRYDNNRVRIVVPGYIEKFRNDELVRTVSL